MALSKPCITIFSEKLVEKINKMETSEYSGVVNSEEILTFCLIECDKPLSIKNIRNLLGGSKMEYLCIELQNSFDCYAFCKNQMIKELQETKYDIKYFEERLLSDSNVMLAVIKKEKKNGSGDQLALWCVIRMTVYGSPNVGFS